MKAICQLVIALIVVPILLGCSKASKPMPVIVQTAAKGFNTPWDVGEEKLCFTAPDAVIDNMPVYLCDGAAAGWFMATQGIRSEAAKPTELSSPAETKAAFLAEARYFPVHLLTAGKVVPGDASTKTPSQTVWNCTKRPNGSIDCR